MNAASILGRILGGFVADETGPANIVYPMTILSGVQCLGMWLVTSDVGVLVAFVLLYGFCSGIFIAVLPVIVAQISPEEKLGGRIGALYTVLAIAQLVGSPIGGSLIRKRTDYAYGYAGLITFGVRFHQSWILATILTSYRVRLFFLVVWSFLFLGYFRIGT